jgi:hypothetical protein
MIHFMQYNRRFKSGVSLFQFVSVGSLEFYLNPIRSADSQEQAGEGKTTFLEPDDILAAIRDDRIDQAPYLILTETIQSEHAILKSNLISG